jgi:hypothetical protein
LGLAADEQMTIEPFRLLPGDDASCLNLYAPRHPRILGARPSFIGQGRFAFRQSLAANDAERANPWRLLDRDPGDGVVPVIADANFDDLRAAQGGRRRSHDRRQRTAGAPACRRRARRQPPAKRAGDVGVELPEAVSGTGGLPGPARGRTGGTGRRDRRRHRSRRERPGR